MRELAARVVFASSLLKGKADFMFVEPLVEVTAKSSRQLHQVGKILRNVEEEEPPLPLPLLFFLLFFPLPPFWP